MDNNSFHSSNPYPPVKIEGPNIQLADMMLSNMGGSNSEMSAIGIYLYDHFVTKDEANLSNVFQQVAITEMHHLNIFGQLSFMLGADPRLWEKSMLGMRYWSPGYLRYSADTKTIIDNALSSELAAIQKYRSQMEIIKDEFILANLARIIQDEEVHAEIFRACPTKGI